MLGLTLPNNREGSGLESKSKHLPLCKSVLITGVTELKNKYVVTLFLVIYLSKHNEIQLNKSNKE